MTTQKQIRAAFWSTIKNSNQYDQTKRQNGQPADVRCAFVDFVDSLAKRGEISERLAEKVTL